MTRTLSGLMLGFALTLPVSAQAPRGPHDRIAAHVRANQARLVDIRRDLHRHPEVSGREERTARVVAERLRALGLEVQTGVGGHGVVGVLRGGRPGPTVAYRADMDAIPSTAPDPVDFRSETPGVRHICGHDLHVTIGLGLAAALASVKGDLGGRVMFIFQPAEERAQGARAMLDAGVFREKPAAIYGVHTAPLAVGTIASRPGRMMFANVIAPGVVNDEALTAAAKSDIVQVFGASAYVDLQNPPAGFSEDFGHFQAETPGVFFFLGASNPDRGLNAMPHSPDFAIDEGAIAFGIRSMAAVLLGRLTRS